MRVSVPTSPLRTATAEEAHFGATLSEAYSVDSSVRIEASSAAIDSEVHVQTGDFSSGEVATVLDDLPLETDLRVYPDAMVHGREWYQVGVL
jgi:hypothetical protein